MLDFLLWPFWGYWRYKREQNRLWDMLQQGHDIGMLPGGHPIHYSICECREEPR